MDGWMTWDVSVIRWRKILTEVQPMNREGMGKGGKWLVSQHENSQDIEGYPK
jgi:hypothetical protein